MNQVEWSVTSLTLQNDVKWSDANESLIPDGVESNLSGDDSHGAAMNEEHLASDGVESNLSDDNALHRMEWKVTSPVTMPYARWSGK